ncbi:MAG: hypothetical protein ABFD91_12360, partial [Anaerohalosphaeraceae bacterium]
VALDASGACGLNLASGTYTVRAECQKGYESTIQTIEVRPQEKTELRLAVHRVQEVTFKWRFYDYQKSQIHTGQSMVRSGQSWTPEQDWADIFYPVIQLTSWDGRGCMISSVQGGLGVVEKTADFDTVPLPMHVSETVSSKFYPLDKGAIYTWYRNFPNERYEALIQIEDIRDAGEKF